MGNPNSQHASESLPLKGNGEYDGLINRIRNDDHTAAENLTRDLSRGARFLLSRRLHSDDVERQLSDTLSAVTGAIKTGLVNDSKQLLRFTLAMLKRQHLEEKPRVDGPAEMRRGLNLATSARSHPAERIKTLAESIALKMSLPEMEVLRMYYVDGETQEAICRVRCLSDDEFGRIKAKVKVAATS
jgi:hypothetical protein